MLGTFQNHALRLRVPAQKDQIKAAITHMDKVRQWASPQRFPSEIERLEEGTVFSSFAGPIEISHRVVHLSEDTLEFVLWGAIDGTSLWRWDDGWFQQQAQGVTLVPLALAQTLFLHKLKNFLAAETKKS
jgi:hypothetical protein